MTDCKHAELSLLAKGFGAKQQNELRCRCGLTWKINFAGGALSVIDDQERDREEFHGPSIKSQLEPHSCKVCMTLFTAITRISDLHHLQNVVATAQGHINRHHS